MAITGREPILSARGVSKTFSGKTVLRAVELDLLPGEVHGLLGHNGSGKSTLIKILAGYHAPDDGAQLQVGGRPVALPLRPGEGRSLGISFVHQDLALAEDLTILENLRVGRYRRRFGWRIDWPAERRAAAALLEQYEMRVSPDTRVAQLTGIQRALVAILRALDEVGEAQRGVLVLDEPTAYLSRDGVELLFRGIRQVAAGGFAVLFVSHRLDEVKQITDRVTVLRDGARAALVETDSVSERDLAEIVLGRTMGELYPETAPPGKKVALRVAHLSGRHVRDFSFDVHEGEIVGITGLVGMGHEEVPYLLFGAQPASGGTADLGGRSMDLDGMSPRRAIAEGMALLPEQRLRYGGAGGASVTENLTLASIDRHVRTGRLRLRDERSHVSRLLDEFDVLPRDPDAAFATLSGGNQQKALAAKWFETEPRLLLLHEPTHGVDVGARHQIFEMIGRAAATGCSVLMASAEYEDLAQLCDRVFVFRNGAVAAELSGAQLTAEQLVQCCYLEPGSSGFGSSPGPA